MARVVNPANEADTIVGFVDAIAHSTRAVTVSDAVAATVIPASKKNSGGIITISQPVLPFLTGREVSSLRRLDQPGKGDKTKNKT